MGETDVREDIKQIILDADLERANARRLPRTTVSAQSAELAAGRIVEHIAARVPAGIDGLIERYVETRLHLAFGDEDEDEAYSEGFQDRDAALRDLRAAIGAATGPRVVTDEMVVVDRADLAYALLDWHDAAANAPDLHEPGGRRPWWGETDEAVYQRLTAALAPATEAAEPDEMPDHSGHRYIDLGDGAYAHANMSPDASPEAVEAVAELARLAHRRLQEEATHGK